MKKQSTAVTSEDSPPLTKADIATGKLVLRQRGAQGRLLPNKQRVHMLLDRDIVDHFKIKAGERGYQTLINESLREAILGETLTATIRKTIRAELRSTKKAA